jgi:hypothetical protein
MIYWLKSVLGLALLAGVSPISAREVFRHAATFEPDRNPL